MFLRFRKYSPFYSKCISIALFLPFSLSQTPKNGFGLEVEEFESGHLGVEGRFEGLRCEKANSRVIRFFLHSTKSKKHAFVKGQGAHKKEPTCMTFSQSRFENKIQQLMLLFNATGVTSFG